jgi:hypothetical protein
MRAFNLTAAVAVAVLMGLPTGARAHTECCKDAKEPCCATQPNPCCHTTRHFSEPQIDRLTIDQRPTVERMAVTFRDPVVVGDRVLMGKYVIEHDTNRMARGRPCTYIYEHDRRLPAVAFHCRHLKRDGRAQPSVTLVTDRPTGLKRLIEYQFAGEAAGHGVPVVR